MDLDIAQDEYQQIERRIVSENSPVGIDAKHTHIIIIAKLAEIERRLKTIEASLS